SKYASGSWSNWAAANSGISAYTILSLAYDGTNLFAGTSYNGVYLSTNNGTSWSAVNTGLPASSRVLSLVISGTTLFAGTSGNGVYSSPVTSATWTVKST